MNGMITVVQYEVRTKKLKADVLNLEAITLKSWGKEDELKQLKSNLAALDRTITAELAPKHDEQDGEALLLSIFIFQLLAVLCRG